MVDDGSTDDTLAIIRRLEREIPFMTAVERAALPEGPVRDRLARAAAPRTFNAGLALADVTEYTHVMKLDGDIELKPSYFRELIERFEAEPALGLAGGVLDEPLPDGGMRRLKIAPHHVHGALKLYTRECFERIGGVEERLGWDTIDETYARMRGFTTAQLHRPRQHPPPPARQRRRHGPRPRPPRRVRLHRALHDDVGGAARDQGGHARPAVLSGLAFFYGFARAAARRVERVPDPDYRRFTRRELRRRMLGALAPRYAAVAEGQRPRLDSNQRPAD